MEWFFGILAIVVVWAFWAKANDRKKMEQAIRSLDELLDSSGYSFTIRDRCHRWAIGIDEQSQKIIVALPDQSSYQTFDFSDLIKVTAEVDGVSVHTTNRGSQALGAGVGAVLFGPAGFIVGGLSGSSTARQKLDSMSLSVYTRNLYNPLIHLPFYIRAEHCGNVAEEIQWEATAKKCMNLWYARFTSIIGQ